MRIACLESRPIRGVQPGAAQPRSGASATAASRVRRAGLLCALATSLLLALSAPAYATSAGEKVILHCTHNESLSGFSQSAYRQALKELEADLEEYSPCSQQISEAERAAAAGGHGGTGTLAQSTAAPVAVVATPSQQLSITKATTSKPEAVKLGGGVVHPGVVHVNVASALNSLPTPLLATLAFLLAGLLVFVGVTLRNRVRAKRSD
jgi:hypothetical protein